MTAACKRLTHSSGVSVLSSGAWWSLIWRLLVWTVNRRLACRSGSLDALRLVKADCGVRGFADDEWAAPRLHGADGERQEFRVLAEADESQPGTRVWGGRRQ